MMNEFPNYVVPLKLKGNLGLAIFPCPKGRENRDIIRFGVRSFVAENGNKSLWGFEVICRLLGPSVRYEPRGLVTNYMERLCSFLCLFAEFRQRGLKGF